MRRRRSAERSGRDGGRGRGDGGLSVAAVLGLGAGGALALFLVTTTVVALGLLHFAPAADSAPDRSRPALTSAHHSGAQSGRTSSTPRASSGSSGSAGSAGSAKAAQTPKVSAATVDQPEETQQTDTYVSDVPHFKTCKDAHDLGIWDIYQGEPGYRAALDHDGDGIACDK